MKRKIMIFLLFVLAFSLLVSCEEGKKVEHTTGTKDTRVVTEPKAVDEMKDIYDLVSIKEAVNQEGIAPNGEKVRYIYEVPIILIDKPGAQKINETFLSLEKDMEERIGDGQNLTIFIESKAYLNDGIISVVMDIKKPGPGGIYVVNYDIEKDQEVSTKELLEKYHFDPQKLIEGINRQVKINESKPEEERSFMSIDFFIDTINTNGDESPRNNLIELKTLEEKESYVIENIDKLDAYINHDGKIVFIHMAELEDKELVVK